MLRVAIKTTVEKCGQKTPQSIRTLATESSIPKKSSFMKKLVVVTGVTTAAAGATMAYAYVDPSFRTKLEEKVNWSKEVFQNKFGGGTASLEGAKQHIVALKDRLTNSLPSTRKANESEERLLKLDSLPPISTSSKSPTVVDPVDVRAVPSEIVTTDVDPQLRLRKNKALEESLMASLASSTSKVQIATDAKIATMAAINDHAKLLKKTVDDAQNADWDKVAEAQERIEKLSRIDAAEEVNARNYLDNIRQVVRNGRANNITKDNPLLTNSVETANKLGQQLDELNVMVQRARTESQIMNQYKDLIDKSRKQFALELKAILPNIDIHAKDSKLSEDELNALIAHAHLRVDQLRRQLAEQQLREEQNIGKAIEQQRLADAQFAENQLSLELKRVREQTDVDIERKVIENRKEWEQELEERLRRAAAAHSEHLEQVVRTQRQLCDIEQSQKVEEAIAQERNLHNRQILIAQGKLDGIEAALSSRVAADVENRRSKQFWIACQNLMDSVVHGRRGGLDVDSRRKPLASELQVIKEACAGDEFVNCLLSALPNESIYNGVYTEQDLKARFAKLYKNGRRVAKVNADCPEIMCYIYSYLQNAVSLDLPRKFTSEDKVDPNSLDAYEILARAKYYVDNDDLTSAVRVVQLLSGEAGRLARDWIADARIHLETRLVAELLVAHAAVSSIRAVY